MRRLAHGREVSHARRAREARRQARPPSFQRVHRLLHILSVALITAGLVVLADVATTLAWKEPVSSVYGSIQQGKAEDELADLEGSFPSQGRPAPGRAASSEIRKQGRGPRRPVREAGRDGRGDRPDRDPEHRPRRGRRPGHRHREPPEGAGALSRRRRSRARAGRRRSPATAPPTWPRSAISTSSSRATRSRSRCRTPTSPTGSRARGSSTIRRRDRPQGRLRAARAHRLPPAVQRRPADRRVREARGGQLLRARQPEVVRPVGPG